MNEFFDKVIYFIKEYGPEISAIVGFIITTICMHKNGQKLSSNSVDKINQLTRQILEDNAETRAEAQSVKKQLHALQVENEALKKQISSKRRSKIYGEDKQSD